MPVLYLFSVLLGANAHVGAKRPCYEYGRDTVELRGQVVRRVYPGRPNYESIKQGDEPDTVYVLRLASPLCTVASPEGEAQIDVREVQLDFSAADARAVKAMNRQVVKIHGVLEEWAFGWHHLPVLLEIRLPRSPRTNWRAV
jgi:hypothetical protein